MAAPPRPPISVPYQVIHGRGGPTTPRTPPVDSTAWTNAFAVHYLVAWADALVFYDEIMGHVTAPITLAGNSPLPEARAISAAIFPQGNHPWTTAVVTVEYEGDAIPEGR